MWAIAIFAAGLLAACAATAPAQPYYPRDAEQPLMIGGRWNGMQKVVLTVNGENVATGNFGLFGTTTDMQGQYEGRAVDATCTYSVGFWSDKVNCITFVDGRRGPTLTLAP